MSNGTGLRASIIIALTTSHTRTVVREYCKGDDASQWGNGKIDPCHAQAP